MFQSNIDDLKIIKTKDEFLIFVTGWYVSDHDFRLRCQVNQKEYRHQMKRVKREDIISLFRQPAEALNGFEILIEISNEQELKRLALFATKGLKKKTLLLLKREELSKYLQIEPAPFYCVDRLVGWNEGYYVEGYAFKNLNSACLLQIVNEQNEPVEQNLTRIAREDVYNHFHLPHPSDLIGFKIYFDGEENKEYFLQIEDRRIPLLYDGQSKKKSHVPMDQYHIWQQFHRPKLMELKHQKETDFQFSPRISIIVATYNTPDDYFMEMLESVRNQTYANWELCIADGSEDRKIEELIQKSGQDSRIRYKKIEHNLGIADNMNEAIKMASGEYIGFFDHDDLLTENALFEVVNALQTPNIELVYSDEDKIVDRTGYLKDPHFKPDFNIDLIRSQNYICHFLVMKSSLVHELKGFDKRYDGAQDFDFVLRAIEKINASQIIHIPKVLYHWRMHAESTSSNPESKLYAFEAGKRAIKDHLARMGQKASVEMGRSLGIYDVHYQLEENPLISIIIPNCDHIEDLNRAVCSLIESSNYQHFEIIIVENNSKDPATFAGYEKLKQQDSRIQIVTWDKSFNYAAINNFGVEYAKGTLLLFLNNDTKVLAKNSLKDMAAYCMLPHVGAAGARLEYEDGSIQHAGVVMGLGGIANHSFMTLAKGNGGYFNRVYTTYDVSAVTAACLMMKRTLFDKIHGFDETFEVAYNDMDLCMKIRKEGMEIVYVSFAHFYHFESKSRGIDNTPEKKLRFKKETERFLEKWETVLQEGDPYYNPNFSIIYPGGYELKEWDVYELKEEG